MNYDEICSFRAILFIKSQLTGRVYVQNHIIILSRAANLHRMTSKLFEIELLLCKIKLANTDLSRKVEECQPASRATLSVLTLNFGGSMSRLFRHNQARVATYQDWTFSRKCNNHNGLCEEMRIKRRLVSFCWSDGVVFSSEEIVELIARVFSWWNS